jgi:hypothetical protein
MHEVSGSLDGRYHMDILGLIPDVFVQTEDSVCNASLPDSLIGRV